MQDLFRQRRLEQFYQQQLDQYWPQFVKHQIFKVAYQQNFQADELKKRLMLFFTIILSEKPTPLAEWTPNEFFDRIERFHVVGHAQDDYDANMKIISVFVLWMAQQEMVYLEPSDILLRTGSGMSWQKANELKESEPLFKTQAIVRFSPNLPRVSMVRIARIQFDISNWGRLFIKSADFQDRHLQLTPERSWLLIDELAYRMYLEYRQSPKSWTGKAIASILTTDFVRDLIISADEYSEVGTLLAAFVNYCGRTQIFRSETAKTVHRAIERVTPKMVALGQDERNYSQDKREELHDLALMDESYDALDANDSAPAPGASGTTMSKAQWRKKLKKKRRHKHH